MFVAFIIFTIIFILVVEIFTVLLQLTGLSRDKSRFQVISLLTGAGYTTSESEIITASKTRRKIAQYTMIFGYCSTATIVSLVVGVARNSSSQNLIDYAIGLFIAVAFLILLRVPVIASTFDNFIGHFGTKALFGGHTNVIVVKDSYEKNVIAEVKIKVLPEFLINKSLNEAKLSHTYGLMVLVIEREKETILNVSWNNKLQIDDTVTVYGSLNQINNVFYRMIKKDDDNE